MYREGIRLEKHVIVGQILAQPVNFEECLKDCGGNRSLAEAMMAARVFDKEQQIREVRRTKAAQGRWHRRVVGH